MSSVLYDTVLLLIEEENAEALCKFSHENKDEFTALIRLFPALLDCAINTCNLKVTEVILKSSNPNAVDPVLNRYAEEGTFPSLILLLLAHCTPQNAKEQRTYNDRLRESRTLTTNGHFIPGPTEVEILKDFTKKLREYQEKMKLHNKTLRIASTFHGWVNWKEEEERGGCLLPYF